MDASYKIQRGIHVHLIQFFMCPEFWVHITLPLAAAPLFGSPSSWGPQPSPTQWVGWGEEEQGSGRSFRRQAEAELSGLCDDEDGGLIGGASLKPADFVEIINSANQE